MWTAPRQLTTGTPPTEESCPLAEFTPLTGYGTKLLDDFHFSGITEMIFPDESSDKDAVPSYLFDAELDDETIGKALSSPLFIQERVESADGRQAYHSNEESLLPAQSFFAHSRTERPVHELGSLSSCRENQVAKSKTRQSGFSLNDKSKFSLIVEQRFTNTSSKPILIGEVSRKLNGIIESQRREIDHALACDAQLRRDQLTTS